MMAAWMVTSTAFALLLGIAAIAAERALRTLGRQARGAWLFALVGAVGWPAVAPAVAALVTKVFRVEVIAPTAGVASTVTTIAANLPALSRNWITFLDVPLVSLWVIASLGLLVRLGWAMRALSRIERAADRAVIDGVSVLVTQSIGPAVFGTRDARVLVPRWLLDLDAPLRELVLLHEQEHCRARDPQLSLAVAVAIVLMPWNAGVWWIARRLRLAVELDCDARVLRAAHDIERYSKLLLFIAQRQSLVRLAPMLAESNSHLSRRIATMNSSRATNGRVRVAALAAVAVLALAYSTTFASALTVAPSVTLPPLAPAARTQAPAPAIVSALETPAAQAAQAAQAAPAAPPQEYTTKPEAGSPTQVDDRNVMAIPGSPTPRYPQILKEAGVEGGVVVAFVVDTNGVLDPASIKVIGTTHQLFAEAFIAVAPSMRFLPAVLNGVKVRQVVQWPVLFNLVSGSNATVPGREETKLAVAGLLTKAGTTGFYTLSAVVITGMVP
jgi:TonB family protein